MTFSYLASQIENFSHLGNQMKLLFRVCPIGRTLFTESGGFRMSGIRRASSQKPRKISDFLREERSTDSFNEDPEDLTSANEIDQVLLRFEESWANVERF